MTMYFLLHSLFTLLCTLLWYIIMYINVHYVHCYVHYALVQLVISCTSPTGPPEKCGTYMK